MAVKKLSQQRRWQLEQKDKGNCVICTEKLNHYKERCDSCAIKHRKSERNRSGNKPYRKDGPGQSPIVKEQ